MQVCVFPGLWTLISPQAQVWHRGSTIFELQTSPPCGQMEELHLLRLSVLTQWSVEQHGPLHVLHGASMNDEMVQTESGANQRQLSFHLHHVLKLNLFSSLSPLHVRGLCVALTLTSVLSVQQCASLWGVLAL